MTRINVVPPHELNVKHLVAEYRELPRIFGLVRKAINRGDELSGPKEYTLGTGHVRFFYDKVLFLYNRQIALVDEMKRRGYNPNFIDPQYLVDGLPDYVMNDWEPTDEAITINRKRIQDRLNGH